MRKKSGEEVKCQEKQWPDTTQVSRMKGQRKLSFLGQAEVLAERQ